MCAPDVDRIWNAKVPLARCSLGVSGGMTMSANNSIAVAPVKVHCLTGNEAEVHDSHANHAMPELSVFACLCG